MSVAVSVAHRAARNAASVALASAGPGVSSLRFYSADDAFLGALLLAQPCAVINDAGRMELQPGAQSLVQASGSVARCDWCDGAGAVLLSASVTDAAGDGVFKLQGTAGTQVYAGGVIALVLPALLG